MLRREVLEAVWLIWQGYPMREVSNLFDISTAKLKRLLKRFKPRDPVLRSSSEPIQLLCDLSPIPDLVLHSLRGKAGDNDERYP